MLIVSGGDKYLSRDGINTFSDRPTSTSDIIKQQPAGREEEAESPTSDPPTFIKILYQTNYRRHC